MKSNDRNSQNLTESRFRMVLLILKTGGVAVYTKKLSIIQTVYNNFLFMCAYSVYLATIFDIIYSDDLQHSMKTIRMVPAMLIVWWTELYFRFRRASFERLLELTGSFTWEELPKQDPETGYTTMTGWLPLIHTNMRKVYIIFCGYHLAQSTFRMIATRDLVYSTWYPFEATTSPAFEIINLSQIIATIQYLNVYMGFPYLYVTLVCIACSQLEKLKRNLLELKQKSLKVGHNSDTVKDIDGATISGLQEHLNECIRHHQEILKFLKALEDTMNMPLCGIFLSMIGGLCTIAFSAVTNWGDHLDVSQALTMYVLFTGLVFVYCGFGTIVTHHCEGVRDAAWSSDWVGTPITYQSCIVFIIAKANEDFTLTAGKFVSVSNSTMMNMLNQSLSFFMFLLKMKDKSEAINN